MDEPMDHAMGEAEADAQPPATNSTQSLPLKKRMAFEESNPVRDTKRIKTSATIWRVAFPEKPAVLEEQNGEIEFRVVNNDGSRTSTIILTGLKCLFQKQLPKMPKDYIARLVYDRAHLSIAIVKMPLEVIGGITFREFRHRKFAEIVFCAVSSDQQVKGYGAHLMAHLKDYVKATSPVMHFLTYADNYATGYFQKQGFTKDISLDKSIWMGYIKDYEGGTLMQCSMVPRIRYLEVGRMLLKQKATVQAKMHLLSSNHIVHPPPPQWANVDKDEVPDYYKVITSPMDLSTVEEKLERDDYAAPKELVHDLKLIFSNCRQYNDATTVYAKCAVKLEKYMWSLIKEIPEWYALVEDA
ncbi:histone acetyltransferase GCN5 [Uncinocarpus reesii 1704]|uniref:Histone acetyltransferase GCN5 n=1 Tax=Uncinocarpus reesii (strain UAMH 1704) TaxID=336963 RepID=C4JQH4_UNCRE|nr:histone acetyltransferase GCN5 [Uncinocarpus reesii 1704]EEP78473.1 histone acetyltransferase GCN5 [Uncinocarpus reesii 1704]